MKKCKKCHKIKNDDQFGIHRTSRDGLRNICKLCASKAEIKRRSLDPDKYRAIKREEYKSNPIPYLDRAKKWSTENSEKRKEIARNYARRNIDKINAWTKSHPENIREGRRRRQAIRKARQKGTIVDITSSEWLDTISSGKCIYCGRKTKLTVDHFVPISMMGETTIRNLVPSCVRCNSRKNNHDPKEWVISNFGKSKLDEVVAYLESRQRI